MEKDTGNANVGQKLSHPEIQRRHNEIAEVMRDLSDDEHIEALFIFAKTKWQRLRNPNQNFKANET